MWDSLATQSWGPDAPAGPNGAAPRLLPGATLSELDSGAREQTYLLSLPDGRNFQLAGALYHLAVLLDGERTHAEIAAALATRIGRPVAADDVAGIIDRKLAPLGVLAPPGMPTSAEPPAAGRPRADAALGIFARLTVVPPRILEPVAEAVKHFYAPAVAVPIVVAIFVAHLYAYQQLAPLLASLSPATFPLVPFLIAALCVQLVLPWHELGHAAAARYFGAKHGPLGVGLMGPMLVAFVEVTDIWPLSRRQRLVVDLGGVYFQAMSVIVLALVAWLTGSSTPLWIVLAMDLGMLMNLNPLFKLDGYWSVSDATGITNLHQRVGAQLGSASARALLRLGGLLRIAPLTENAHLRALAAQESQLRAYGASARVALVLFSVLFVLSAVYFLLLTVVLLPMLALSYPLQAVQAWQSVWALVSGGDDQTTLHVMMILQFVFTTVLLVGVVGMVVQLVRAWRNRGGSPGLAGGLGWHSGMGGMNGMGW